MATSQSLLFIYNPAASRGERANAVEDIRKALGDKHMWIDTKSPRDAERLASAAVRDGFRTVVAVGGDGTTHEVVNGLMMTPREKRATLGILPTGSGNDFAYGAGIPLDLSSALDVILRAQARPVDIGSIEDNRGIRVFWDNSVGIGFDAKVTIQSNRYKTLRGFPLYFLSTIHTLIRHHDLFDIEMTIDSHRYSEKALMVTLGNGTREGGGFYTTPHSKPDDGQFELLLIKPISRLQMLGLLPKVMSGKHLTSKSVFTRSFTTLNLQSRQPLSIHVDGEIYTTAKESVRNVSVRIKHNAINVLR